MRSVNLDKKWLLYNEVIAFCDKIKNEIVTMVEEIDEMYGKFPYGMETRKKKELSIIQKDVGALDFLDILATKKVEGRIWHLLNVQIVGKRLVIRQFDAYIADMF